MKDAVDQEDLALGDCDREPIHRPGFIQPFGALLAGPADLSRIDFASENVGGMLEREPDEILGRPLSEVLDPSTLHRIRNLQAMATVRSQRERAGQLRVGRTAVELFVHINPADQLVLEFEPADGPDRTREDLVDRMRLIIGRAAQQGDLVRFLDFGVHGLRDMTGYDRVMAYRYAAGGDGEVVAEARSPGVESFLGLRYPAWDVPLQARAMQLRTPIRMLVDVGREPVALRGHTAAPGELDISLAHLRGVSPIHVEYLANMGVRATLTISLVVDGRLWGMLACHHHTPKIVRPDTRIAAELFGQMISLLLQQKLEAASAAGRARACAAQRRILAEMEAAADLAHAFPVFGPILQTVVRSDGIAVVGEGRVQSLGSVPSNEAIRAIGSRLPDQSDLVEATDRLAAAGWAGAENLAASAGCLQVRCLEDAPQILFFRDEVARSVRWAGKPEKRLAAGPAGPRLAPRASFETWLEQQDGTCAPWSASDRAAARELQRLLMQLIAKAERAQLARHRELAAHQRQQGLLIAELNHRVKNILALICSLSRQAKASSSSLESYAQALEQRIAALAAAHDQAVSNDMQGASLRRILETELQPHLSAGGRQVRLTGPVVGLRADVAPMIALVVHEMVTNAAKYGALSDAGGIVEARWRIGPDGLHFRWKETGGPEVRPPARRGFGRSLIEKAIPYEFDGEVTLSYPPDGVALRFRLPADALVHQAEDSGTELMGRTGEIADVQRVADGMRVLLVEDNIVLAMDMVDNLTRLGASSVRTAGTVDEALRLARDGGFDFAMLDVNLRGRVSFEVAETLRAGGTPFCFVTGYGAAFDLPPAISDAPILTKPVDDGTLSTCVAKLIG